MAHFATSIIVLILSISSSLVFAQEPNVNPKKEQAPKNPFETYLKDSTDQIRLERLNSLVKKEMPENLLETLNLNANIISDEAQLAKTPKESSVAKFLTEALSNAKADLITKTNERELLAKEIAEYNAEIFGANTVRLQAKIPKMTVVISEVRVKSYFDYHTRRDKLLAHNRTDCNVDSELYSLDLERVKQLNQYLSGAKAKDVPLTAVGQVDYSEENLKAVVDAFKKEASMLGEMRSIEYKEFELLMGKEIPELKDARPCPNIEYTRQSDSLTPFYGAFKKKSSLENPVTREAGEYVEISTSK